MNSIRAALLLGMMILGLSASPTAHAQATQNPATGPLRVHPTNPRYFTDGAKHADGPEAVVLYDANARRRPAALDPLRSRHRH